MSKYSRVRTEIFQEQQEIGLCTANIVRYRSRLEQTTDSFDREVLMKALGAELHSFYTGTERIFEKILKNVDRQPKPKTANWHKYLVVSMSLEVHNVRGAVISSRTLEILDELRRFRHVIRSNYLHRLKVDLIVDLAWKASECHELLTQDLSVFDSFLTRQDAGKQQGCEDIKIDIRHQIRDVKQRLESDEE